MTELINNEGSRVIRLRMTFHFFLIFLGTLVISCDRAINEEWKVLKVDPNIVISFKLDSLSSNYWPVGQLWTSKDGSEYLIHQNPFPTDPNRIFFSSLDTSENSFLLNFEVEGPDGVGWTTDFYFHDFDSIFLIDRYSYKMFLVDSTSKLKKVYRLKESDGTNPDDSSVLAYSMENRKIIKLGNSILIPAVPDIEPFETNYALSNLVLEVNIENGEVKRKIGFPRSYQGEFRGDPDHFLPSFSSLYEQTLLVSYPIVDSIFSFDLESNELNPQFYSGSLLVNDISAADPSNWGNEQRINYQLAVPRHYSIIYDPYRKYFLRVSFGGFDSESVSEMTKRRPALKPRKSSLVFHDISGRVIERFIVEGDYNPSEILVLQRGLFIAIKSELEDEKEYHKIIID